MSKKIEDILIKAIKNPKTTFFKKYKISSKNENLIREAYDIKKKYGKNTTKATAIKKGYKRKKFVSTNNNYKSLLGS
jgi:hypothetical protein